jgi:exonuclease V
MLYVSDSKTRAGGTMPREENSVSGKMQLMLYKEMLDGMVVEGLRQHAVEQKVKRGAEGGSDDDVQIVDMPVDDEVIFVDQSEKATDAEADTVPSKETRISGETSSSTTMDRFRWQDLFEHLSLDPDEPFTETFLEQSRPLIQGNNLSVSVATASTLQDMTSCWAEYVAKLGLGTIDPAQSESQIEEALQKETGGRRIGRSEKLLTLVYRRIGKTKKKTRGQRSQADESSRKPGRGKRRKREKVIGENEAEVDSTAINLDSPSDVAESRDVEAENDRLLQLAIAESLIPPALPNGCTQVEQETQENIAAKMDNDEEPLPASLVPPEVFQAHQQRDISQPVGTSGQPHVDDNQRESQAPDAVDSSPKPVEEEDGSIIGSHRFAYSSSLLSEHIDRILQFWTGSRDPVGVSIENTTRCGWCEFEEGCEWR